MAAAVAGWAMTACSAEKYEGANGQLPLADEIDAVITVDQSSNQVTFKLNNAGYYPIWKIEKSAGKYTQSTVNGYTDLITKAGTYNVEVQMGNRNGVCQGSKSYTFTIENSIKDWGPYMAMLTNNATKRWEMAYKKKGHIGYGESGSDGLNKWSAGEDEKAGTGMYETILEFGDTGAAPSGSFKLDPGTDGKIYVNKGVTSSPYGEYNPNDGNDYSVPFELRESTFSFNVEGETLYIELPAGQTLNYLPFQEAIDAPRYRVLFISRNKMELVVDNGDIAWHYIFVPEGTQNGGQEPVFEGYDYNNKNNLYLASTPAFRESYTAVTSGWLPGVEPEVTVEKDEFTVNYTEAPGTEQWQAQVKIDVPGFATQADKTYDVSVEVESLGGDLPKATFKLTKADDDDVFLFEETEKVPGYEKYIFHREELPGVDCDAFLFVFDFAGAPAGEIKIRKITVIEHSLNPGPFPGVSPEPEKPSVTWVDENSDDNLWKNANMTQMTTFWAQTNDWIVVEDPSVEYADGVYTVTANADAGYIQWQGQFHIESSNVIAGGKEYDIRVVLTPDVDITGATVKVVEVGGDDHDNIFLTQDRHDIYALEDNVIEIVKVAEAGGNALNPVKFTFDFAGLPAGKSVKISGLIIQEHRD